MRTRPPKLALAALGIAALALCAWLAWRRLSQEGDGVAALVRLEQALEGPGSFALVHADLARLRPLLGEAAPALESALLRAVGLREVEAHGEISRALLALSRESDRVQLAAVLLGRFDVSAIEAALGASPSIRLEEASHAGQRVLYVERIDPETCRESRHGVALAPERIALAGSGSLEALLSRLGSAGLGSPDIDAGKPFLVVRSTGALELPPELDSAGPHALFAALGDALGAGTRIRANASTDRLGSLELEVELDASDAPSAAALLARWNGLRAARLGDWTRSMPDLARWIAALELGGEGDALRGTARLDRDTAVLPRLADDALVLAAVAFQSGSSASSAALEAWPATFRESQSLAGVPAYRSDAPLAGAADAIAGPFGIRVENVRGEGALELELRAVGPDLPNTPAPQESPRFVVDDVRTAEGASLLDAKACGAARAELPQPLLRGSPAALVEARKTLRLLPGTALDAVDEIRGRVELELAVRTQSVAASELRAGQMLEVPGTTLELTEVAKRGFAYRVRGAAGPLLFVRGLDAAGTPLAGRELWQAELPISGERIGALRHAGELASVEAIFALERERAAYPFALESARPGSDGEAMHVESSSFIAYSAEQYDREFHASRSEPRPWGERFKALAPAGPFQVGLASLDGQGLVAPRLTVIAPDIPNLTYNATGLELRLEQLVLRNRGAMAPGLRTPVAPGHRFGNLELEGEVHLVTDIAVSANEVERLSGQLVLRLPSRVEVLELTDVAPGHSAASGRVSFALTELSRDGFALRMRGPLGRFFSARAFAADDRELAVKLTAAGTPGADGTRELRFRVQGQPRRIAIQLARGSAIRRYPFELVLPAVVPAAPAP